MNSPPALIVYLLIVVAIVAFAGKSCAGDPCYSQGPGPAVCPGD